MKTAVKYILHRLLGFHNYLFLFSLYKIYSLKWDKKENDFFFFLKHIPVNTTVLDIGANIGIMTTHLARSIKGVHVFAFEPMPSNIKALNRIINHFNLKNVTVLNYALGNTEGELEMIMPVINSVKMQGLSHVMHDSITEFNEGEKFKCPVHKLDNLSGLWSGRQVSGIKIDVENFEYFVLDGGKEFLKVHRPLVYAELWENENRNKCFELMKSLGYNIYVQHENKIETFNPGIHKKQNFILSTSLLP